MFSHTSQKILLKLNYLKLKIYIDELKSAKQFEQKNATADVFDCYYDQSSINKNNRKLIKNMKRKSGQSGKISISDSKCQY